MQGKILSKGILRAEDGNRYSFEISDIENLDEFQNGEWGGQK